MADNSLLVQNIVNGKFTADTAKATTSTSTEETTRGSSNLGKDAFLQLLVAEMQNQDPLEPSTNTEWISQLATFSQLEELQSLSETTENTQIFSLTGKHVIIQTESATGGKILKSGTVDFISYSGGEAKFSVNGALYSMDNLYSIVSEDYFYEQNKPSLPKGKITATFNGDEPSDVIFEVDMGNDVAKAEDLAVLYGKAVLSSEYVNVVDNKVIISEKLLQQFEPGNYSLDIVFSDKNYTTVNGAIDLNVYNTHPVVESEENSSEETPDANANKDNEKKDAVNNENDSNNTDGSVYEKNIDRYSYEELRNLFSNLSDEEFEAEFGDRFKDTK